jgi:hypothetical protein
VRWRLPSSTRVRLRLLCAPAPLPVAGEGLHSSMEAREAREAREAPQHGCAHTHAQRTLTPALARTLLARTQNVRVQEEAVAQHRCSRKSCNLQKVVRPTTFGQANSH